MARLRYFTLFTIILLTGFTGLSHAQFENTGGSPIEIYSDGGTRFEGGLAVSTDNVVIFYGSSRMYADYAQYNPETKDVVLRGHVKIYQEKTVFTGESALYNLDTKTLRSTDFLGSAEPFLVQGENLFSMDAGAYGVKNGFFTTHDSSKPDFRLRARSVRIYPDNRIIFTNVTLFIGNTPSFWFPYLYQSLDEVNAFLITPGYAGRWGAYLLTSYTFPITENTLGRLHLDYRSDRGPAAGLDLEYKSPKTPNASSVVPESYSNIRSYILSDSATQTNQTTLARPEISTERYRLSWQAKLYFSEDWSATIDANKLSDSKFLEDFYPTENRVDPQPDTVGALTRVAENWTFTLLARGQLNDFQQTTERLPELALDFARRPIFGTKVNYEGETSLAFLNKAFTDTSVINDFSTFRADTFHQISYPNTYFGWLSIIPRAGFRLSYYDTTGSSNQGLGGSTADRIAQLEVGIANRELLISNAVDEIAQLTIQLAVVSPAEAAALQERIAQLEGDILALRTSNVEQVTSANALRGGRKLESITEAGAKLRTVFNFGVESSFKVSRTYDDIELRWAGLDGVKHVVQPYLNFTYVVQPSLTSDEILPIDTFIPSTQLPPFDFPQAVALDSIDETSVLRLGVRNRLLTKRNDQTFTWFELDTFFNVNFQNPYDTSESSNLFNRLRFSPVPWASLTINSQIPLFDDGFSEVNTNLSFMPNSDLSLSIGHRYLQDNPFFTDSSLVTFSAYYQITPNWAFSFNEQFELEDSVLESQRYTLYRDLTSWVASLSTVVRDNRGKEDIGVYLTFTLKELPNLNLNFNFDPAGSGQD